MLRRFVDVALDDCLVSLVEVFVSISATIPSNATALQVARFLQSNYFPFYRSLPFSLVTQIAEHLEYKEVAEGSVLMQQGARGIKRSLSEK